jgi:signal transduction histidine kinase/HAMP domain-containing protein
MSQNNPKYKRLEALLSDAQKVKPEPPRGPEDQAPQSLKVEIPQPDAKPAALEAETVKAQASQPDAQPVAPQVETLKTQVSESEAKPIVGDVEITKTQVIVPVKEPAGREPAQPARGKVSFKQAWAKLVPPRTPEPANQVNETGTQHQLALWTAGIFTILGVIFFFFSLYNVIILQQGHVDPSDTILTPVTILMIIAGVSGFMLIRRGRFIQGLWLTFAVALIPPIMAVLVLGNVFAVALTYLVILALAMITWVFPASEKRKAIIATAAAILVMFIIELWNPAFRLRSTTLQNFAPFAIGLAAIGLVAFFIRQAAMGSIRTKLITAFVLMALLSMGLVAYSSLQTMRVTLTENIGNNLNNLAQAKAVEIGQTVKREFDLMSSLAITDAVRAAAIKSNQENTLNQSAIASLDQQWMAADAAENDAHPLVVSVLDNELATNLALFKEKFPQHVEVFLTNAQGVNVAATNRTSDYYQADEGWWQTAFQQGVYIGQPEFDESSNTVAINMASAIYGENSSDVVGVLRTTVNFNTLEESLISGLFGQTGKTDIYLPNNMELELEEEEDGSYELELEEAALDRNIFDQTDQPYVELLHDDIPTLASQALVSVPGSGQDTQAISGLDWRIVAMQVKADALQSVDTQTRNSIALFVAITALVGVAAVFLARLITNPIVDLKTVAEKVAAGDLNTEAKVSTHDEVGTLAATFNNMTSQLKNLVGSLEQRVADRTHDLELASEVGRAVTEKVADLDDMLTTAAEMIRARFGLYYTQVYLTDPAGRVLLLRAGTGDVGEALLKRGHRLMIDYNSLNGRAALDKKPVIVADTLENPTFKPNPLLPKTRSEMAVPLISGDRILGMLDMQSEQPDALSEASLPAFEALAGQLAIAIQNSELFAETEQARAEIEAQARRLTRSGWTDYMDAIHKPEQTSYVFAENQLMTLHGAETPKANSNAFSLPLEITGEPIGNINVELENDAWTTERKELVQSVARQVAQQIENLRLLETAERYREEAEQITRRLTHEGWEDYTETLDGGSLGFAYDLGEVVSFSGDGHQDASKALAFPLSIREEAIGQLTVDKGVSTTEAQEIIQVVASQLSSHIENLRLSEQNERRAAELEQAVNRLRELDRLKSSFLANMSHELRTPLNSILGFADVMLEELDGPLTANMHNDLGLIQKNGQHLLHLINDVLDMAKIEAGRMNLNPEKFRVHEILDDVTSITSALASDRNLALFIEPDSDRVVEITADRTRLRQVMINLVNNSIKFTEKGGISIHASRMDDKVLIRVKDTGIGIPLGKLEEVFTEFAQVDTSTTRKAGGTGLGLPISRRLIEMHGGRLWAESSGVNTEGSTFYVELPLEAQLTEPVEKLVK